MALKNLAQFQQFAIVLFLEGKRLVLTGIEKWVDYTTKQVLGNKAILAIVEDNTPYKPKADGTCQTNLYEKLTVKVPGEIKIPVGTDVTLINPTATIWGEFRNQLSVKADDIVPANKGGKP